MPRATGQRLPAELRRQAVATLQSLLAAGVTDGEAREQIAARFDVSARTARTWLNAAYAGLAKEVDADRRRLVGVALRRRRLVMARAAKNADWKTYLSAADSEARLLGLDAPKQTEHHVLVAKAQDLSQVVIDAVRDHFSGDPIERARFVRLLRERLSATLARRVTAPVPLLDAEVPAEEPLDIDTIVMEEPT